MHHPHQRCLAGAVGAKNGQKLAGAELEAEVLPKGTGAEAKAHPIDADRRRAHRPRAFASAVA